MKKAAASLLITFIAATAQAGSFGGPPPFTNGSPLPSGTDGTYVAIARAKNVTGSFRFTIQDGAQTSSATANSWVFFVDGNVYKGSTQATISQNSVSGVLDGLTSNLGSNGQITFPIIISSNYGANGEFNGTIDQNSPEAAISGKGSLVAAGQNETEISYTGFFTIVIGFTPAGVPIERQVIDTQTEVIPGQDGFGNRNFKFNGSRVSTPAS